MKNTTAKASIQIILMKECLKLKQFQTWSVQQMDVSWITNMSTYFISI
jgi:hypothetical protein